MTLSMHTNVRSPHDARWHPVRDELILELARLVDDDTLQGCPGLP